MNGKLQHWVIKIVDQSDRLIVFDPKPSSGRLPETRSNWKKSKNFLVRKLIQKSVLTNMGSSNTKLITARQVISAQKTDYKAGIYGSHLIGPPLLFLFSWLWSTSRRSQTRRVLMSKSLLQGIETCSQWRYPTWIWLVKSGARSTSLNFPKSSV